MNVSSAALLIGAILGAAPPEEANCILENPRFRATVAADATWRSLIHKDTGNELLPAGLRVSLAQVRCGDRVFSANRAQYDDRRLVVRFAGCDTRLVYRVLPADDWVALVLEQIGGTRPDRVVLLQVPTTITEHVGRRLNGAWNSEEAVCLRGVNLQTHGFPRRGKSHTVLCAESQDEPGPRLEGSGVALLVAPTEQLRGILAELSRRFQLPRNERRGIASKDLPMARQSYWFLSFSEKDVDRVIDYCRRTGFRQVMLNSGAWCTSVGHFTFNRQRYPDGIESLRRTVARLHEHGILVGMHTFASKVSKHDPYVTPVPNRGFVVDRRAVLAADIGPEDTQIRTTSDLSQWPGSAVCRQKVWEGHVSKHQEVIIDDEIIQYQSIGPEGRWDTFLGCKRGAWGTRPAAHRAQADCQHWAVDGCINGYILDQDAPLFQETTSRLAHIFNYCDFDMVYFDGSEDVDRRRYWYYASNAHAVPLSKFTKRPVIHAGGGFTFELWHSFTRTNTVDQYPGTYLAYLRAGGNLERFPTCKDHIDRSVRGLAACADDMIPGELGWFGIGPKSGHYAGLQPDEIEYLMCKSLAYDAPISLQTSFARMEAHPLTPDLLEIVRRYEQLRLSGSVPPAVCEQLKATGRDFVLLPAALAGGDSTARFVPVERLPQVAGTEHIRAFVGPLDDAAVATVWHYVGNQGELLLATGNVVAYTVQGDRIELESTGSQTTVPIGPRRLLLHFPAHSPGEVRRLLAGAVFEPRKPVVLWLQAEQFARSEGPMHTGRQAGVDYQGAFGDVVLCTGPVRHSKEDPAFCEYRVKIPHAGRWTLWARVRYPTGGDMSFGLVLPGQPVTLSGNQVLGNCGVNDRQWHWTGRGGGVTTVPPGQPIVFDLPAGTFTFQVWPREGPGTAKGNPQVDCFCLADDPHYRPNDQDAQHALAECGQ